MLRRIGNRIANEPVLIGALIIALGNLYGADLSETATQVEAILTAVIAFVVRHKVTPMRKLQAAE